MSEFSVEPDKLAWLGERYGYVGHVEEADLVERVDGEHRADKIIAAWARTEPERAFLEALSVGHEIAEARRISGISRHHADACLRRIRGVSDESHIPT